MIPATKVFVGNLPPGSKPGELRRLFESYGVVTECDIMNRCGFVHMETQLMAESAIEALNNATFKGSVITVEPGRMKDRSKIQNTSTRKSIDARPYDRNARHEKGNRKNASSSALKSPQQSHLIDKKTDGRSGVRGRRSTSRSSLNSIDGRNRHSSNFRFNKYDFELRNSTHLNFPNRRLNFHDRSSSSRTSQSRDRRGFTLPDKQFFDNNRNSNLDRFIRASSSGSVPIRGSNGIYGKMQTSGYSDSSSNHTM